VGFKVSKGNREETKPAVVCDYNQTMGAIDLKDQMQQPYLLEQKKGCMWCMKLFEGFLNVAIHNTNIIYHYLPNNKGTDPLIFRPLLVKGLVEKHVCWPLHCIWPFFS
jgi:hypothetical protein